MLLFEPREWPAAARERVQLIVAGLSDNELGRAVTKGLWIGAGSSGAVVVLLGVVRVMFFRGGMPAWVVFPVFVAGLVGVVVVVFPMYRIEGVSDVRERVDNSQGELVGVVRGPRESARAFVYPHPETGFDGGGSRVGAVAVPVGDGV